MQKLIQIQMKLRQIQILKKTQLQYVVVAPYTWAVSHDKLISCHLLHFCKIQTQEQIQIQIKIETKVKKTQLRGSGCT